jgi:hypothetical protein
VSAGFGLVASVVLGMTFSNGNAAAIILELLQIPHDLPVVRVLRVTFLKSPADLPMVVM